MKFTDQGVSRMKKKFNLSRPALSVAHNAQLRPSGVKYEGNKNQKIFFKYFSCPSMFPALKRNIKQSLPAIFDFSNSLCKLT